MPVVWLGQTSKRFATLVLLAVDTNNQPMPHPTRGADNWKISHNDAGIGLVSDQVYVKAYPLIALVQVHTLKVGSDLISRDHKKYCEWISIEWSEQKNLVTKIALVPVHIARVIARRFSCGDYCWEEKIFLSGNTSNAHAHSQYFEPLKNRQWKAINFSSWLNWVNVMHIYIYAYIVVAKRQIFYILYINDTFWSFLICYSMSKLEKHCFAITSSLKSLQHVN